MEKKPVPYRKTVLVCCNTREGEGAVACANPGRAGDKLCAALKDAVKKAGLKSVVRVARSGCLGLCAEGPNLFVLPDGEWYSKVQESDLPALIARITAP